MPMASDAQLEKSSFVLFGQQSGVARRTYDAGHGAGCEHSAATAGACVECHSLTEDDEDESEYTRQCDTFKLVHVFDVDHACA